MNDMGPWDHKENIDHWRDDQNGDKSCSFCGSLSPEDFERYIDLCLQDVTKCRIEPSDKSYKFYIFTNRIEKTDISKFYTHHIKNEKEWIDRINTKLTQALIISHQKLKEKYGDKI
jgi:hypothetical protein